MAKLGFEWKSDEVEDEKPFGEKVLFPAGEYIGVAVKTDVKDTKTGTGRFVEIEWQIVDGVKKGSIYIDRMNVENHTPVAQRMARGSYKSLQKALKFRDEQMYETSNIHHIPVKLAIRQYESKSSGKMENGVSYYPADGSIPVPSPAAPPPPSAEPSAAKKPWQK